MAEPGKYKKDGVTRVANDKGEANALVWQGFKPVGQSSSSGKASSSKPAAKKAATKKPSETATAHPGADEAAGS